MLEALSRIIPFEVLGPLLIALIVWGGLSYVYLGPEVGRRIGAITLHPRCVSEAEVAQAEARRAYEEHRRNMTAQYESAKQKARWAAEAARRQAEIVQSIPQMMPREFRNLLGAIAGRDVIGDVEAMIPDVSSLPAPTVSLPKVPEPLTEARPATRTAWCSCLITKAREASRTDLAFYAGTLRAYSPALVVFEGAVATMAKDGTCGELPIS